MAAMVKKANIMLGVIKKSFATLDTKTLPLSYESMITSHLEYMNIIRGPSNG